MDVQCSMLSAGEDSVFEVFNQPSKVGSQTSNVLQCLTLAYMSARDFCFPSLTTARCAIVSPSMFLFHSESILRLSTLKMTSYDAKPLTRKQYFCYQMQML